HPHTGAREPPRGGPQPNQYPRERGGHAHVASASTASRSARSRSVSAGTAPGRRGGRLRREAWSGRADVHARRACRARLPMPRVRLHDEREELLVSPIVSRVLLLFPVAPYEREP